MNTAARPASRRRVLIVCPLFPPARGGLPDHTARLAAALAQARTVSVLTSHGEVDPSAAGPGVTVHPDIANWRSPDELTQGILRHASRADVLWQYVPHMYGRGGVNFAVPAVLGRLRARGLQQLVIAHELYGPWSAWPQRAWYAWAQRRQWQAVQRYADALGVSTEAWLEQRMGPALRRPQRRGLLPSPSSFDVVPLDADGGAQWRRRHALDPGLPLLLFFGSLGAAKQFGWVQRAWEQAHTAVGPVGLVVVGEAPQLQLPPKLAPLYRPQGFLPAADVSRWLQCATVALLPFIDGVSERRTSFMAALQHGCPVVTTSGPGTGRSLRAANYFVATPCAEARQFCDAAQALLAAPDRRAQLARRARAAYAEHYAWPCVTARILDWLAGM